MLRNPKRPRPQLGAEGHLTRSRRRTIRFFDSRAGARGGGLTMNEFIMAVKLNELEEGQ